MAYLRKIKGRYFAYFTDRSRRPKQKSIALGTSLKSAAVLKYNDLQRRFADPHDPFDPWLPDTPPQDLTIAEAVDQFLVSRDHLRHATQVTYAEVLGAMQRALPPNLMLSDLGAAHLQRFISDPALSRATQRRRFTHARVFCRWVVMKGFLMANPLDKVRQPKREKKSVVFLAGQDLERLLKAMDYHEETRRGQPGRRPDVGWLRDMVRFAVCTGMRRSELLNLRWSDVDLEHGFIIVRNREDFQTKSGHERSIPLAGDAVEVLRRLDTERTDTLDGPVFLDAGGLPIKPVRVSKRFKDFVRLAKLDERIHFHSLRHTTGSWLAMQGVPLRVIQAILGHASITTTEMYSHLLPETMQLAMQQTFGK